ncbi:MAG TPA: hypothetical protein PLN61_17005, partial [bacterium]|nr:hypothetical protein [bacterium]
APDRDDRGWVLSVAHVDARLAEAEKMGFRHAVIPRGNKKSLPAQLGMHIFAVSQAQEALDAVLQ